jgi:hypothetical protein
MQQDASEGDEAYNSMTTTFYSLMDATVTVVAWG